MGLFRQRFRPTTLRPLIYCPWGDSIAYGSNASPRLTARWSTLVANQIMRQCARRPIEINVSIPGAVVVDTLNPALDTNVLIYNPELIILAGGLNDMRKGTNTTTFQNSYDAMVAEAVGHASVSWVVCCSLPHITDYDNEEYAPFNVGSDADNHTFNTIISARATANGAEFADVHGGMDHNDSLVDTDGIHPNNAGHANIAATVAAVVVAAINS